MENNLSSYLDKHATDRYQAWNDIVKAIARPLESVLERHVAPAAAQRGASTHVVDHVRPALRMAAVEAEFVDVRPLGFFHMLVEWLACGHFPCGWGTRGRFGQIKLSEVPRTYDPADPRAFNGPVFAMQLPDVPLPPGKLAVY